jgi:hypothetical protein
MLAYLTYFGNGISPRMWTLWPRLHAVVHEFGIDFWDVSVTGSARPVLLLQCVWDCLNESSVCS